MLKMLNPKVKNRYRLKNRFSGSFKIALLTKWFDKVGLTGTTVHDQFTKSDCYSIQLSYPVSGRGIRTPDQQVGEKQFQAKQHTALNLKQHYGVIQKLSSGLLPSTFSALPFWGRFLVLLHYIFKCSKNDYSV
jgi:hypothetical protein